MVSGTDSPVMYVAQALNIDWLELMTLGSLLHSVPFLDMLVRKWRVAFLTWAYWGTSRSSVKDSAGDLDVAGVNRSPT